MPDSDLLDQAIPCPAGCRGQTAEPEQDDDLNFYACTECGYEFGYQRLSTVVTPTGCARGIPEDVRRRADPQAQLPLLQIGTRPA